MQSRSAIGPEGTQIGEIRPRTTNWVGPGACGIRSQPRSLTEVTSLELD